MLNEDCTGFVESEVTKMKNLKVRRNLSTLLQGSTIIPFKWHGNNFHCFFCSLTFHKARDLKTHTEEEHEGFHTDTILKYTITPRQQIKLDLSDLSCKLCSESFQVFDDLIEHLVAAHDLRYTAGLQSYFMLFDLSDDHLRNLRCIHCGEQFEFFSRLLKHMFAKHYSGNYVCETCGRTFLYATGLKKHFKEHTSELKYKCELCGKQFRNATNKRDHEGTVHGTYTFLCECGKKFTSTYKLKRHKVREHDKKAGYHCEDCGLTFCWKNHLIIHINNVHLDKRVSCPVCGKAFHPRYLKEHMVSHTNARPYECRLCKKSFARSKTLKAHMKTH